MNKKIKSLNNNGVALITIVIAVAFLSIIGSALLYITYTNFRMKVLNLNSKENFYETDGELVKITAGIRNSIEDPADLDKFLCENKFVQDSIDPKRYVASKDTVKLEGKNGILDKAGLLNDDGSLKAHDNGDTFTYSVGNVEKYVESGSITTYTIRDLKVKQVAKDGHYTNSVQTDLQIKVREQTGGSSSTGGLGNCSVLMDSNIKISAGEFAFVSFLGNAYCASYGGKTEKGKTETYKETEYTIPSQWSSSTDGEESEEPSSVPTMKKSGVPDWVHNQNDKYYFGCNWDQTINFINWTHDADGTWTVEYQIFNADGSLVGGGGGGGTGGGGDNGSALYLKDHAKVNVEGDNLVVYGDIVLTGSSCLNISKGKMKVFGDIYLLDDSMLICGGEIYLPDFILPGRSDYCAIKSGSGTVATADYLKKHMYYKGTIHKITDAQFDSFAATLNLKGSDLTDDGIVNRIAKKVEVVAGKEKVSIFDTTNVAKNIESDYYGQKCGISFMMPGNVANLDQYKNYLVFLTDNGNPSGTSFNLNAANVHSTFISRASVYLNTQNGIYYTKMGPELFEYLKISDKNSKYYQTPSAPDVDTVHDFSIKFDTNDADGEVKNLSISKLLSDDTDTQINNLFNVGSSNSSQKSYINSASFHRYIKDAD